MRVKYGKAEISNAAPLVRHHENVLALHIAVRDRWLALCADDLRVQVDQTSGGGDEQLEHLLQTDQVPVKIIIEGTVFVIVRDEPELRARVNARDRVGSDKSEDVLVTEKDGVVDRALTVPRCLRMRAEYLDGDVFTLIDSPPHLTISSLAFKVSTN